jgi:hypothetical protein
LLSMFHRTLLPLYSRWDTQKMEAACTILLPWIKK